MHTHINLLIISHSEGLSISEIRYKTEKEENAPKCIHTQNTLKSNKTECKIIALTLWNLTWQGSTPADLNDQ